MAENHTTAIWISATGGISLLTLLFVLAAFQIYKKRKNNSSCYLQTINFKKSPPYTNVPIKVQIGSSRPKKEKEGTPGSTVDFSQLLEERAGYVDPLLGVLHSNQQTKIQLPKHSIDSKVGVESITASEGKKSDGDIITEEEEEIILEAALVWASNDRSLTVLILQTDKLKLKFSVLYVHLSLESSHNKVVQDLKLEMRKEFTPKQNLTFSFKGLTLEDVHSSFVKMDLIEKRFLLGKDALIARGFMHMNKLILVPNKPLDVTIYLRLLGDMKCSEIVEFVGTILVGIKCCFVGQISAKFNLELKRADKLPTAKTGGGEFWAELFLLRDDERLTHFATQKLYGNSPEWNSCFTFDMQITKLPDYSLEIMIMRKGSLSGITRVAGTTLCNAGRMSSIVYWEDAVEHIGDEIILNKRLTTPCHTLSGATELTYMGLLLLKFVQTNYSVKSGRKSKFEFTIEKMAHFEYEKSWGEYKLELLVSKNGKQTESFSTQSVPSANLVWNAGFTFIVDDIKGTNWNVDITLIRVGRLKRSAKIGRTSIDADCVRERQNGSSRDGEIWLPLFII